MEQTLLGSAPYDGRVRRNSAGNLSHDPSSPMSASLRAAGAAASHHVDIEVDEARPPAREPMEVEDALDEIGGLSWYQLRHIGLLSFFWFFNAGTTMSLFANTPWCATVGSPALCLQADALVAKSPQVFWSDCRSLSCQFDLQPTYCAGTDDGAGASCLLNGAGDACAVDGGDCAFEAANGRANWRPLFDSSFFLGWLWSVPLFGWISDRYGRRISLFGSLAIMIISQVVAALSPNAGFYLVARHFNGVGFGSQALAAYVLGTELAPRKTAPQVKVVWACFSTVGTGATALLMYPILHLKC